MKAAVLVVALLLAACSDPASPPAPPPPSKPPASEPAHAPDPPRPSPAWPADPRARRAEQKRGWVRENPIFKDHPMTWVFADPYVVFQEVKKLDVRDMTRPVLDPATGLLSSQPIDGTVNPAKVAQNEEWAKKAEVLAQRDAALLVDLHKRFRELFAERCKLPDLASKDRMLTVAVMWDRASFGAFLREAGYQIRLVDRAYYSPAEQKVLAHAGLSPPGDDEIPCAGGQVQNQGDQALLLAAALQLIDEYTAIGEGAPLVDGDTSPRPVAPRWFERGVALYLSAVEEPAPGIGGPPGAAVRHERVLLSCVAAARQGRVTAEKWEVADLLAMGDAVQLMSAAKRVDPADDGGAAALFDCRAWAFVHFLWNYDAGRYRARFLDCADLALQGKLTAKNGAAALGDGLEMEFAWYWQDLIQRKVGRDPMTREWFTPGTDAPAGRAQDDEEFVTLWKAGHPGAKETK